MTTLICDILYYIFQDLNDLNDKEKHKKSVYSCLLVNKLWCEVMIPILWRYPCKYIRYIKENQLFNIIISHLSNNSIKLLKDKGIIAANFKKEKLSFNYVRFCKYLDNIHVIFPRRRESSLLKEEIYKLFISECSSIKSLDMDMLNYPIYQYPRVNISVSNLYELNCKIKKQNFYHELAQICRLIEKIYIRIYEHVELDGLAELIEKQNQIKFICINERDGKTEHGGNKKLAQALEKHANSIILLNATVRTSLLYFLFPKLINLQFLKIFDEHLGSKPFNYITNEGYHDLQILELHCVSLNVAINIIQNTNGNLWKIFIGTYDRNQAKEYNQAIHKYCLNIKYVTVYLNRSGTLKELENIFIKCRHLEVIYIYGDIFKEHWDKLLDLLIKSAPLTLYKIQLLDTNRKYFNDESLKLFYANWNCRSEKTLQFDDYYYNDLNKFIEDYNIKESF